MSDADHGPFSYETEPAHRIGWATSEIVNAIKAIEALLASGLIDDDPAATWERNYDASRQRSDLEREARHLRTALDVLDPKGTSITRRRLEATS